MMTAIINDNFRIDNAKLFRDGFATYEYFMALGRTSPWVGTDESPLANDANPPNPSDSNDKQLAYWRQLIGAKKIESTDVSLMIPRYDWESGTVYDQYDSSDGTLFQKTFYVITDDLNVYKCISNNNGADSTVKPVGTSTSIITTGDGYRWKFMYTVNGTQASKFLSPQFIPVDLAVVGDGSNQAIVQAAAVPGQIVSYRIKNPGSGYTTATLSIAGDGTGATATVNVSSGQVIDIVPTALGSGYNLAKVSITGDGTGAEVEANIAPNGGHGSDARYELGAYYVAMAVRFEYDESGYISTQSPFRQIIVLRDPVAFGTTTPYTSPLARQTYRLQVASATGFVLDEEIEGQSSGATATIVDIDTTNNLIYVSDVDGIFGTETIQGQTSLLTTTVSSITDPDMALYSGRIIYIENKKPQPRDDNQVERIITVLEW